MNKFLVEDPYLRFAMAMIERAVEDCKLKKKMMEGRITWLDTLNTDPEYWLFESKNEEFPSFLAICSVLDCNPDRLRASIKQHLKEHDIEVELSAVERVRRKIKEERIVIRYEMVLWAWRKLGVKKKSLNNLIRVLVDNNEVMERKQRGQSGRVARYYYWIGEGI